MHHNLQPERFDSESVAHGREPVGRTMKSVLVSGASGFLGSSICRVLVSQGVRVRALVRDRRKIGTLEQLGVEAVIGDLTNPETLEKPVKGVDTVIHSAALIGPPSLPPAAFEAVNVAGTRNLLGACKRSSGLDRFVHVSTVAVVGSAVGRAPASESAECRPIDAYGESKLLGEQVVLEAARSGFPAVIARPMWIYGSESVVTGNLFRRIAQRRFPLLGRGDNLMQPVALRDAVSGVLKCATVSGIEGRVYNIAGPEVLTVRDMCAAIAAATNVRYPVLRLPMVVAALLAFSCEWGLPSLGIRPPFTRRSLLFFQVNNTYSIERARRELDWHPVVTFRKEAAEIAAELGLAIQERSVASGR